MMKDIEVVVFDLGRVLLNIDPNKSYLAFQEIGIPIGYESRLRELFFEYESGIISEQVLFLKVKEETRLSLDISNFWACWELMILDFIPDMIERVELLTQKYICVLLSNTNHRHQCVFESKFHRQYGKEMDDLFDFIFYSHDVGHSKPSADIYCYVEKRLGRPLSSLIFFDDLEENLDVASSRGWKTFHVTSDLTRTLDYIDRML